MRQELSDNEVVGICIGSLAAIAVAGLLGALRGEVDQANGALALVLIVIGAAYTGGRWAGGATAMVAAISFDFFLTEPYQSLAIKNPDDVLTTVLLLAAGLAVGTIAASRREAKAESKAGTDEVAGLYRVAQLTAEAVREDELIRSVEREVEAVLRLRACHFERLPHDELGPELDQSGHIDAPYRFEGDGFSFPPGGVSIAVRVGDRALGWLKCIPAEPVPGVSRDRRRAALVLANHLALALAVDAGHTRHNGN